MDLKSFFVVSVVFFSSTIFFILCSVHVVIGDFKIKDFFFFFGFVSESRSFLGLFACQKPCCEDCFIVQ